MTTTNGQPPNGQPAPVQLPFEAMPTMMVVETATAILAYFAQSMKGNGNLEAATVFQWHINKLLEYREGFIAKFAKRVVTPSLQEAASILKKG